VRLYSETRHILPVGSELEVESRLPGTAYKANRTTRIRYLPGTSAPGPAGTANFQSLEWYR
jgi:hypothetical protein